MYHSFHNSSKTQWQFFFKKKKEEEGDVPGTFLLVGVGNLDGV
jgi:hypothetical protein